MPGPAISVMKHSVKQMKRGVPGAFDPTGAVSTDRLAWHGARINAEGHAMLFPRLFDHVSSTSMYQLAAQGRVPSGLAVER